MSGKSAREQRQAERQQAESTAGAAERRTRLMQLAAGAVFLAIAVVLVLIVVTGTSSDGGDTKLEKTAEVNRKLAGIPQDGMVLGDPKAPVELVEFADLQCPYCKAFTEDVLPGIIENQVKKGEVKVAFHNFTIIGEQSLPAGAAALAAGAQGRGWNFVEIFYANQGAEDSGYADDEFLEAIAKGAGVGNIAKWSAERSKFEPEVEETTAEAQKLGFEGTPSLAVKGPSTDGLEPIQMPESVGELEDALSAAR